MLIINKLLIFAVLQVVYTTLDRRLAVFFDVIFAVLIKFVGRRGMRNL